MSQNEFMATCSTYQQGRCNGVERTVCGTCGGHGHGNCYGNGDRPIRVPCKDVCAGRYDAIEKAGEEIIRAAKAWYGDGSRTRGPLFAEADALEAAVAERLRLEAS